MLKHLIEGKIMVKPVLKSNYRYYFFFVYYLVIFSGPTSFPHMTEVLTGGAISLIVLLVLCCSLLRLHKSRQSNQGR